MGFWCPVCREKKDRVTQDSVRRLMEAMGVPRETIHKTLEGNMIRVYETPCSHYRTEHGGIPGHTVCSDCDKLVNTRGFGEGTVSDGWQQWWFYAQRPSHFAYRCEVCGTEMTEGTVIVEINEEGHTQGPGTHFRCAEDAVRLRVEDALARHATEKANWCRVWGRENRQTRMRALELEHRIAVNKAWRAHATARRDG